MNPNASPFLTPEGFFEDQRNAVLRQVRTPQWPRWAVAASVVLLAGWWATREAPCETYACLLEATPLEELPVDWAEAELLEYGDGIWPEDVLSTVDHLTF